MKKCLILILLITSANYSLLAQEEPLDPNKEFAQLPVILIKSLSPDFPYYDLGDLHQSRDCVKRDYTITFEGSDDEFEFLGYEPAENVINLRKIKSGSRMTSRVKGYGIEMMGPENSFGVSLGVARIKRSRDIFGNKNNETAAVGTFRIQLR